MPLYPARWEDLPRPVGFVLSGGATLGALQVGMLRALATAGIEPDLVAGTSVGALNGAVVADIGLPGPAADVLEVTWRAMTTATVFRLIVSSWMRSGSAAIARQARATPGV